MTLRKAIWLQDAPRRAVNQALNEASVELEGKLREVIDTSDPQGIVRRLATTTSRFSARGVGNRRRGTKTRAVTGATFYRASAPGQPPAIRTGALYRSLRVRRAGDSIIASTNKNYAKILDDPHRLNRPFFRGTCREYFKEEFKPKVRARIHELVITNA